MTHPVSLISIGEATLSYVFLLASSILSHVRTPRFLLLALSMSKHLGLLSCEGVIEDRVRISGQSSLLLRFATMFVQSTAIIQNTKYQFELALGNGHMPSC